MKKLSHQFDKPKRSVASPEALEALRNNNAVRWYVLSLPGQRIFRVGKLSFKRIA
ncbi:hypothetical protein HMPREF9011_03291 [Bacteroides sp. 3_1_40A]|nr:hypothetical protein HMPREF9011_03291 [Bacteroides sp. 3_1_40A]